MLRYISCFIAWSEIEILYGKIGEILKIAETDC